MSETPNETEAQNESRGSACKGGLHGQDLLVWAALHNAMTEESAARTLSLHRTRAGAEAAVEASRTAVRAEWEESAAYWRERDEEPAGAWDDWQWWGVEAMTVEAV